MASEAAAAVANTASSSIARPASRRLSAQFPPPRWAALDSASRWASKNTLALLAASRAAASEIRLFSTSPDLFVLKVVAFRRWASSLARATSSSSKISSWRTLHFCSTSGITLGLTPVCDRRFCGTSAAAFSEETPLVPTVFVSFVTMYFTRMEQPFIFSYATLSTSPVPEATRLPADLSVMIPTISPSRNTVPSKLSS